MIVKLNKIQFDYLNDSLIDELDTLRSKMQIRNYYRFIIIEIDEDTADEIRDKALDQQQISGFDIKYELTDEGKILEGLIDLFYTG